jgi:hypothetical protein
MTSAIVNKLKDTMYSALLKDGETIVGCLVLYLPWTWVCTVSALGGGPLGFSDLVLQDMLFCK